MHANGIYCVVTCISKQMVSQYQSSHFYTFMQHLGSWIKFLPGLGPHIDLCLCGKRLTTAANPDHIILRYFSSYSINKGMLTTPPPPPCPPHPPSNISKEPCQGFEPSLCALLVSQSPGCPPAFSILGGPVQLILQHSHALRVGWAARQMRGAGGAAGWSPGQRAEPPLLTDMGKGVGSTSRCSRT